MDELDGWLAQATRIAEEAGALLMEGWRNAPRVEKKGEIDLVTEYDLASEARIRERMREAFPAHALIAEESEAREEAEWTWYVDPLDGTTNFAHGHFVFAVSIGLAHRGAPVLGVIHAPALRTTWAGAVGRGASRNGRPCTTSTAAVLNESLVATGFPYDRATSPENNLAEATHIIPQVRGIRRCGAAAIDLAWVADGTYDGYWEQKLKPWDVCAGIALVQAAGGKVTDYEGTPVDVRTDRLIATNGPLHRELLAAVQQARA